MTKPTCAVSTCEKDSYLRGWCNAHYIRNQRHGHPLGAAKPRTPEELFWDKVDTTGECWLWTASVNRGGYAEFHTPGYRLAHRFSYALENGPIPLGVEIDHVCFNRICVNPSHLRSATHKQNNEHQQGAQSNSSTGIRGVYWRQDMGKWEVKVGHNGKAIHVGLFTDIVQAEAEAIEKRLQLFTHNEIDRQRVGA